MEQTLVAVAQGQQPLANLTQAAPNVYYIEKELTTRSGKSVRMRFVVDTDPYVHMWSIYAMHAVSKDPHETGVGDLFQRYLASIQPIYSDYACVLYVMPADTDPGKLNSMTMDYMLANIEMCMLLIYSGVHNRVEFPMFSHNGIFRNSRYKTKDEYTKGLSAYLQGFGGLVARRVLGFGPHSLMIGHSLNMMHSILNRSVKAIALPDEVRLEHYFSQGFEKVRVAVLWNYSLIEHIKYIHDLFSNRSGTLVKLLDEFIGQFMASDIYDENTRRKFYALRDEYINLRSSNPQIPITLMAHYAQRQNEVEVEAIRNTLHDKKSMMYVVQLLIMVMCEELCKTLYRYVHTDIIRNENRTQFMVPREVYEYSMVNDLESKYVLQFNRHPVKIEHDTPHWMEAESVDRSDVTNVGITASLLECLFHGDSRAFVPYTELILDTMEIEPIVCATVGTIANVRVGQTYLNLFAQPVGEDALVKFLQEYSIVGEVKASEYAARIVLTSTRVTRITCFIYEAQLNQYPERMTPDYSYLVLSVDSFNLHYHTHAIQVHVPGYKQVPHMVLYAHAFGAALTNSPSNVVKHTFLGIDDEMQKSMFDSIIKLSDDRPVEDYVVIGDRTDRAILETMARQDADASEACQEMLDHVVFPVRPWVYYDPWARIVVVKNRRHNYSFQKTWFMHRVTTQLGMYDIGPHELQFVVETNFLASFIQCEPN